MFKKISFDLDEGEKIIIQGPSGVGKTTLLRCISGLSFAYKGMIKFNAQKLSQNNRDNKKQIMSYVPQKTQIWQGMSRELVEYVFSLKNNKSLLNWKDKFFAYQTKFRLKESVLSSPYHQLSGGEQQRLLIIIGLLLQRPLILFDEPTSAMDPDLDDIVRETLLSMKKVAMLIVAHNQVWAQHPGVKVVRLEI